MSDPEEEKHTYPLLWAPGTGNEDSDHCWKILDTIKPGVIPYTVRCFLHGAMMGVMGRGRKRP